MSIEQLMTPKILEENTVDNFYIEKTKEAKLAKKTTNKL